MHSRGKTCGLRSRERVLPRFHGRLILERLLDPSGFETTAPTTMRIYPETNHTRLVGSSAAWLHFLNPAFGDIEHFLRAADLDRAFGQVAEDGA